VAKSIPAQISVGTRVRVKGQPVGVWRAGLKLRDDKGTVVRPDEDVDLGYYVVRLDVSAFADSAPSGEWRSLDEEPEQCDELSEIVWLEDNLEVLAS